MLKTIWAWRMAALTVAAAVCVGCGSSADKPKGGDGKTAGKSPAQGGPDQGTGVETPPEQPKKPEPPPPPAIPPVVMDKALDATNVVRVGDRLPDGDLPDLQGAAHSMHKLLGKKLTIVVFWNSKGLYGVQELEDLSKDVVPKYGDQGLAVIAVNVGDPPEAARQAVPAAENLAVLVDADGSYFAKIAKDRLPRTYAVDAGGKVLWFDADYSESTLRGITQTIQVVVEGKGRP